MGDLVSICRFSCLTGLTIKALRLDDERGLSRPVLVDFNSGARYYRSSEIVVAERIREIRALLDADEPEATRARLGITGEQKMDDAVNT